MITNIDINNIDGNPWQTRSVEDIDHIKDLAESIKSVRGLMQIPTGRMHPDIPFRVQLAFGHSRLAAYRLLTSQGYTGFESFPINLMELDNEKMAVWAFEENEKRKDLDPVERAQAIQKMISDFEWNQQQVAEKLSIDRSTVSNMIRLLKMPFEVLDSLKAGILSQRSAMALLPWYELTPVEYAIIEKRCPDVDDFIALARGGQVQSDTIRKQMDEYLGCLKVDVIIQPILSTEPVKVPAAEEKPQEWVDPVSQEEEPTEQADLDPEKETSEPARQEETVTMTAKPAADKKSELGTKITEEKPTANPAAVGAVTEGEVLLTVKWSAMGVLVGLQRYGSAPVMRFVKELQTAELPFLLNELGIK